ncbi:hypothetical protein GC175_09735 [bacterium]|nr:hypothetical protein [bacterium]
MSPTQSPLRIGIIGAGWPGERHTEGFTACGDAVVTAVADLETTRREAFATRYHVPKQYADYHDLLADSEVDAVMIALPNHLHKPSTIAALQAGKHVFCEKPPAVNTAEAREMADVAAAQGLVLGYATRRRYNPTTDRLAERIARGELGEIYHARSVWTRSWGVPQGVGGWFVDPLRAGGGALIDIGIHVLDQAWFLMGCPKPVTISGSVFNKFPELTGTDDSAFALIRFEDGRSLHVEAAWVLAQPKDIQDVHIYGTQGGARLDDDTLDYYNVGPDGATTLTPRFPRGQAASFVAMAVDFAHAVRTGGQTRTSAEQGVLLMAMLEGIYRSGKIGREMAVDDVVG